MAIDGVVKKVRDIDPCGIQKHGFDLSLGHCVIEEVLDRTLVQRLVHQNIIIELLDALDTADQRAG
tara:strand:- start:3036 stop:3233 length:198 start_codon:yes stop_codon:yes gene_type:complete